MKMKNPASLFSALGDDVRLAIVFYLKDGERCACEIPQAVNRAQPTVSQHLKILRGAGILKSRRDGRQIMYSICCQDVFDLIKTAKRLSCSK